MKKPDTVQQWRYFHNLYAMWQASKKIGIILGFDVGAEQKVRAEGFNYWYTPIIILRYQANQWAIAARAEYYDDKAGVIVPLVNAEPFKMQGYSLNIDKAINEHIIWRTEGRWLKSATPYFSKETNVVKDNVCVTTSLLFSFD